jgi:hypothetical protein
MSLQKINNDELKSDAYLVDEFGNIYSNHFKKYFSPATNRYGYKYVQLICKNGNKKHFAIHRLMMYTFYPIDNMENLIVNHIDGNKGNNLLSNLEWSNNSDNMKHAYKLGLIDQHGKRVPKKLSDLDVSDIFNRANNGEDHSNIAKEYGISKGIVSSIKTGRRFSSVTGMKDLRYNKK